WQPHFISLMPDDSAMVFLCVIAFLYLASAMAGNIISCKILSKYNPKKIYLVLRVILAIILIITALQTNMILFILFYSLIYLFFGMANIPENVILNSEIPNSARASILSVNSLIVQIGMLLGSFVNSFIINYSTIPNIWIIAAVIILISVIIIYKKLLLEQTKENA
uniref:MFS transporter n=1 Tax=Sedimentibacter sp. TaxID=1960295 RepID=UPI0028B1E316